MLTLEETKERILEFLDPDDILEALQITSDELLDRFEDKLVANLNKFLEDFEEDVEDEY